MAQATIGQELAVEKCVPNGNHAMGERLYTSVCVVCVCFLCVCLGGM